MVRIITHSEYQDELFAKLSILKLKYIIAYKSYVFGLKSFNNLLPLINDSL